MSDDRLADIETRTKVWTAEDVAWLIAEVKRRRGQVDSLIAYGRHFPSCDQIVISDHCACGFAQARRPERGL